MRIVSLVPAATEILCALGLAEQIVAISHDCDHPPEILTRPRLTATRLAHHLSSYNIDQQTRESASSGNSLYVIDEELLRQLNPDLVVTQEQCHVCAVDRQRTLTLLGGLKLNLDCFSLAAVDFPGLYRDVLEL